MRKNRIGLVGCGRWGRHILRDLRSLGCAVTVVARSDASRESAQQGGAAAVVDSVDALPDVDGLIVASLTGTHGEVVERCLGRGVPIYVEKPLTDNASSAARIARLAPAQVFVMDKWRYHPGVEKLRDLGRSGELGPLVGLRTFRLSWGTSHRDVDPLWTLAPHDLSIAIEILGSMPAPRAATVERTGEVSSGMVAVLGERPWFVFEVSTRHPRSHREIRLHGRDAVAVLNDSYSPHLEIFRGSDPYSPGPPQPDRIPLPGDMPLLLELKAFVEHLNGGPAPRSSAAEGALVVETLSCLRRLAGLAT